MSPRVRRHFNFGVMACSYLQFSNVVKNFILQSQSVRSSRGQVKLDLNLILAQCGHSQKQSELTHSLSWISNFVTFDIQILPVINCKLF